jgi:prepilin-type N-terminal cleavage/methylation domain-containing protein
MWAGVTGRRRLHPTPPASGGRSVARRVDLLHHRRREMSSMRVGRTERGFTLIEVAIVTAIIVVVATMAWSQFGRMRPRSHLQAATQELHSLIHGARQTALATGHDVLVLVFPSFAGPSSSGRVIVYEDGNYDFFSGGAPVNFDAYDPASPAAGSRSQVLTTLDLPVGVTIGPSTGMGASATLPAPLSSIDVTRACSFCGTLGDGRGAIRFDGQGRVWFYGRNGAPSLGAGSLSPGGSLSLTAAEVGGQRTILVAPTTGTVRTINQG